MKEVKATGGKVATAAVATAAVTAAVVKSAAVLLRLALIIA